ncbi:hypothetical protein CAOG_05333 [Capsaspora owczarzaki ATCC 30864]|uniref:G-protein coupled receptors family 2 profile 2 domain-containing protein n=1 Tax=Capsaspora owczarzaki (strain ATCC 30864) TaxID=595528 RepID=A0A0D2X3R0_CAPO3|nr:hypothetical protein CAOG_05333 [Capsaspora owczarzaki ATCC 30864]KJE94743.1 hypothetical protein, variant 2 [Capsaspora owczarzaki ATCC 30864]KJE94744.1 hypothetical protein, variant 3 [Capsaspora owczarzaki ATCC 30864]|eukprot:XP_004347018.1 hypothetical protein CAOG_05333 [Capsaspora owczarzaki ATCC 30864]
MWLKAASVRMATATTATTTMTMTHARPGPCFSARRKPTSSSSASRQAPSCCWLPLALLASLVLACSLPAGAFAGCDFNMNSFSALRAQLETANAVNKIVCMTNAQVDVPTGVLPINIIGNYTVTGSGGNSPVTFVTTDTVNPFMQPNSPFLEIRFSQTTFVGFYSVVRSFSDTKVVMNNVVVRDGGGALSLNWNAALVVADATFQNLTGTAVDIASAGRPVQLSNVRCLQLAGGFVITRCIRVSGTPTSVILSNVLVANSTHQAIEVVNNGADSCSVGINTLTLQSNLVMDGYELVILQNTNVSITTLRVVNNTFQFPTSSLYAIHAPVDDFSGVLTFAATDFVLDLPLNERYGGFGVQASRVSLSNGVITGGGRNMFDCTASSPANVGLFVANDVTIQNAFVSQQDNSGGALYLSNFVSSISNSRFFGTRNDVFIGGYGGAVHAETPGTLTIIDSTFSGNNADLDGHSLYTTVNTTLVRCTVINNLTPSNTRTGIYAGAASKIELQLIGGQFSAGYYAIKLHNIILTVDGATFSHPYLQGNLIFDDTTQAQHTYRNAIFGPINGTDTTYVLLAQSQLAMSISNTTFSDIRPRIFQANSVTATMSDSSVLRTNGVFVVPTQNLNITRSSFVDITATSANVMAGAITDTVSGFATVTLTATNCQFRNIVSKHAPFVSGDGIFKFAGCDFRNNSGVGPAGPLNAGLIQWATSASVLTASLVNCTVSGNRHTNPNATLIGAGTTAPYSSGLLNLEIVGSVFSGNQGGVEVALQGGSARIVNTKFLNLARNSSGGYGHLALVFEGPSSNVTITDSQFQNGRAQACAAAKIYAQSVSIVRTTFDSFSTIDNGAVCLKTVQGALQYSNFTNNYCASGQGGAMRLVHDVNTYDSFVNFTQVILQNNTAAAGGAIYAAATSYPRLLQVSLVDVHFYENTGLTGTSALHIDTSVTVTGSGVTFDSNRVLNALTPTGSVTLTSYDSKLACTGCTWTANIGNRNGSAVTARGSSFVQADGCTFVRNDCTSPYCWIVYVETGAKFFGATATFERTEPHYQDVLIYQSPAYVFLGDSCVVENLNIGSATYVDYGRNVGGFCSTASSWGADGLDCCVPGFSDFQACSCSSGEIYDDVSNTCSDSSLWFAQLDQRPRSTAPELQVVLSSMNAGFAAIGTTVATSSVVENMAGLLQSSVSLIRSDAPCAQSLVSVIASLALMGNASAVTTAQRTAQDSASNLVLIVERGIFGLLAGVTTPLTYVSTPNSTHVVAQAVTVSTSTSQSVVSVTLFDGQLTARFPLSLLSTLGATIPLAGVGFSSSAAATLFPAPSDASSNSSSADGLPATTVVSLVLDGIAVSNAAHPIEVTFTHPSTSARRTCAFYNFTTNQWQESGLTLVASTPTTTTCQTIHLSSFSVLFAVDGDASDSVALTAITYIGCALSIVGCVLTLASFLVTRQKTTSSLQLSMLCVALLFVNVLFIVGSAVSDNVTSSDSAADACIAIAALLHYFLLAAFAWMLIIGVSLYRTLVQLHGTLEGVGKVSSLLAWAVPLIPVIVILGLDVDYYGSDGACWISNRNALIAGFIAPVLTIIAVNLVIFGRVVRVLFQNLTDAKLIGKEDRSHAKVAASVFVLLGITWVFGVLVMDGSYRTSTFEYLFVIFNSLQGLFIFILLVATRRQLRHVQKRLTVRRKPGQAAQEPQKSQHSRQSTSDPLQSSTVMGTRPSTLVTMDRRGTGPSSSSSEGNLTRSNTGVSSTASDGHLLDEDRPQKSMMEMTSYGQAVDDELYIGDAAQSIHM